MTTPLSQDLRRRIARAVENGSSIRQAAARYEVSPSAAVKLMRGLRETGSTKPDRVGGHRRPVLEPHQDLLRVCQDNPLPGYDEALAAYTAASNLETVTALCVASAQWNAETPEGLAKVTDLLGRMP